MTLADDSTSYVYVDHSSTLQQSLTPPSTTENILIGRSHTNSGNIVYTQDIGTNINQYSNALNEQSTALFMSVFSSGGTCSLNGSDQLDIISGVYYYGATRYDVVGATAVTFTELYNNGSTVGVTGGTMNLTQYDNGGTLTTIPNGNFLRHALYMLNGDRYLFIFGTDPQLLKDNAALPTEPTFFGQNIVLVAGIIISVDGGGSGSVESIEDLRPRPNFIQSIATTGGGGDHQLLSNRSEDTAHSQYLLKSGSDPLTGPLDGGSQNFTNVGTFNGVTVTNLSSRLVPGGLDPLPTGNSVAVGTVNNPGSVNDFSRSDHVHAHGTQTLSTLHAAATGTANGFMSSNDFTKLENSTAIPASSTLVEWDSSINLRANNFVTGDSGQIQLNNGASSFSVNLQAAPGLAQNLTVTMPTSTGSANEFLQTNGAGILTWAAPAITTDFAQLRTTSGADINAGGVVVLTWDTTDFITSNYILVGSTDIQVQSTGAYMVYANIVTTTTGNAKVNCTAKFRNNGSDLNGAFTTGFLDSKVQSESSGNMSMAYSLVAGDNISVSCQQDAAGGVVSMVAGQSVFRITKL